MNTLLERRNGKIYFGAWRINMYECGLWLSSYNRMQRTNIRPGTMTAELFREFLAYQRRVKRMGFVNAPILRERITVSVKHPRIYEYAARLNSADWSCLVRQKVSDTLVVVFAIAANGAVTLAEREAVTA